MFFSGVVPLFFLLPSVLVLEVLPLEVIGLIVQLHETQLQGKDSGRAFVISLFLVLTLQGGR